MSIVPSNEDPRRGCGRQEQYALCLAKPLTSTNNETLCPVTSIDNAPFVPNNETHCSQIAAPRSPRDLCIILLLPPGSASLFNSMSMIYVRFMHHSIQIEFRCWADIGCWSHGRQISPTLGPCCAILAIGGMVNRFCHQLANVEKSRKSP